jgi:hypothetical protein
MGSFDKFIGDWRLIGSPQRKWRRYRLFSQGQTFSGTVVVPYEHLLTRQGGGHEHRGGPVWPHWDQQTAPRFNRDGDPCDAMPVYDEPKVHYEGRNYVWVGPIYPHFGHGMAEFYTRLACSVSAVDKPVLVFASRLSYPVEDIQQAPGWIRSLLQWYGVAERDVLLVNQASRFERLTVFPQAEQLHRVGPSLAYLELLNEISLRNLDESPSLDFPNFDMTRPIYVSRAGVRNCFAGEEYLEGRLRLCGVNILRPERCSLLQQMAIYKMATHLIFSEGSALHGVQLLGSIPAKVSVLMRRTDEHYSHFCEPFLLPRVGGLEYVECTRGSVHGRNRRGRENSTVGTPLLHEGKLLDWFERQGICLDAYWDSDTFADNERKEVATWLNFASRREHTAASRDLICLRLAAEGFTHLAAHARKVINIG